MDTLLIAKVFAGVYLALALCLPIYFLATRKRSRYRRTRWRKAQRMTAGIFALASLIFAFVLIGFIMVIFTE